MAVISLAVILLINKTLRVSIFRGANRLIDFLEYPLIVVLRILIFPIIFIFRKIMHILAKFHEKLFPKERI